MDTTSNPKDAAETSAGIVQIAGQLAQTGALLSGNPQLIPLIAGFTALLKESPQIYLDVMLFFSKQEPTKDEEANLRVKLEDLKNPDAVFVPPSPS